MGKPHRHVWGVWGKGVCRSLRSTGMSGAQRQGVVAGREYRGTEEGAEVVVKV
jgi:hypothetical protein